MYVGSALDALKAIAEETRLRVLAVLRHGELTVTDLTEILGQSQPRISRHLRLLVEAGLAVKHREGTWAYVGPVRGGAHAELVAAVLDAVDADDPLLVDDLERLAAVRARRAAAAHDYFEQIAQVWDEERSLHAAADTVEAAILELVGDRTIRRLLDVGTGTGRMLQLLGERAEYMVGLDTSHSMLSVARANLDQSGLRNWELRQRDVHTVPSDREAFDLVVIHQVLHYLEEPLRAMRQVAHLLAPGGQLLVVDFAPHAHEFLRAAAHRRLGFAHGQMRDWFSACGVSCTKIVDIPSTDADGLTVTLWSGAAPAPRGRVQRDTAHTTAAPRRTLTEAAR